MEMILIGIGISLLTYLVDRFKKRFGWNLSLRLVVVVLCLLAGGVYYRLINFNPDLRYAAVKFAGGAFAASQALWMVVDKFLPKTTPTA